jgi:hypothetical protein
MPHKAKNVPLAMGIGEIERIYKNLGGFRSPQENIPMKQDDAQNDWFKKSQGVRIGVYTNQFTEENKAGNKCQAQPKSSAK